MTLVQKIAQIVTGLSKTFIPVFFHDGSKIAGAILIVEEAFDAVLGVNPNPPTPPPAA